MPELSLRRTRGVSTSLKFRAEIRPCIGLNFHPSVFALEAEGIPSLHPPGNRLRPFLCGVSPCAAPSSVGLRITVRLRARLPARLGLGLERGRALRWGKSVPGVILLVELRVQVGKSNLRIWVGLLMKKCGLQINRKDLIYFQLKFKRDQNRGSN